MIVIALAMAGSWLSLAPNAWGQPGIMQATQSMRSARFIEAPRHIEQELREADRAIAEERMSDAVVRLGDLLQRESIDAAEADLSGQDFLIRPQGNFETRYSESMLHRARRLIGELPVSAIEIYELRYGPLARKTLDEAAVDRNWEAVRDVRRKYFHTLAGYEASLLLAQHELHAGHPLGASLLLDDVVASQRATTHLGESVKMIHASSMQLAGRSIENAKLPTQGQLRVAGNETPWPTTDEVVNWIEERFSLSQREAGGEQTRYGMFGGKPNRNEMSAGQMPLANKRWQVETTSTPSEARTIEKASAELVAAGQLPPPSLMPLRVGDSLLMRTTNRLFGVDYKTGKRIWNYPWYSIDESYDDEQVPPTMMGQSDGNALLSQRVWNDLPYGQMTSDGQRVFFLDDLSEVEIVSFSTMGMRGTRPANSGTNTLVALDLPTEGSLLWRLGEGADEATSLYDAFFLGPPLPLDGRLYVMAEVAGDVLLVCLDPVTGSEIWRQQLVAVETGSIDMDASRRVTGATPTYSEGLLICPTGAGATVAVDMADRMLRWGITYPRRPAVRETMGRQSRQVNPSILMQRWHNGAAIAVDNSLYLTPTESDTLMCVDLATGEKRFADRKRNDLRYLAGVRDGQIILVGSRHVLALDALTGAELWQTDDAMFSTGQLIVGRGVFGVDDYLLPTSTDELVRISLKDGSVLQRRSTRYPLGNLVAVDGEVISQSTTSLAVAYGEQSLEPLVNATLERDPNDFDALVRKSELLIQRGSLEEALKLLEQARAIDAENVEVQMLSVSAMLGLLREGKQGTEELTDQLDSMIDRPSERVEFLALQIRASLKNKQPERASKRLIQLSQLLESAEQLENAGKYVIDDPTRDCELDSWVEARMAEVKEMANEQQAKEIDKQVQSVVQRKLKGSKSTLQLAIRHFSDFDVTEAYTALAKKLFDENSLLLIERSVLGHSTDLRNAAENLSPTRLELLVRSFSSGGLGADALPLIKAIRKQQPKDISNESLDELESIASQGLDKPKWDTKVALDWQSSAMPQRGLGMMMSERSLMRTEVASGETFRPWQLVAEGGSSMAMRDQNGRIIRMPTGSVARRSASDYDAKVHGGMMLLVRGGEITAIDLYKVLGNQGIESMLWQRTFGGDGAAPTTRRSWPTKFGVASFRHLLSASRASAIPGEFRVGTMLGDRVFVLYGGDLMAIDLQTSETLWRNSKAPPQGAVVSDGRRVAVVCEKLSQTAFFSALDGQPLGEEPWEHGDVWSEAGQNVLCFSPTDDRWEYTLRLVNPFTKEVLLETVTATSNHSGEGEERAFGKLVSERYMLLLNTSGQLKVWDLLDAKELVDTNLGQYADLKAVHGVELDGQLVVFPERLDSMVTSADGEETQTEQGLYHKTADALFSFSLSDGKKRWEKKFDSPWGCTLSQPNSTPLLLLTRLRWRLEDTNTRKMKMDALAVDVRDGSTLHERLGTDVASNMNQLQAKVVVQSVQDRVVAQIGNEVLSYKFGEVDGKPAENSNDSKKEADADDSPDDGLDDLFGN
ncbi:MAG: PQQ-binding-like beta-propeller repeat protein [Pirellulaceae bacterium]